MDLIERTIQTSWQHRVLFTDEVFDLANPVLRDTLARSAAAESPRVLCVLDAGLLQARPELPRQVTAYFDAHPRQLRLACPPQVCPGGERAKNSWAHVAALHAAVERYHIDRHSYLIAAGGGAVLDIAGLAAATAHRGVRHVRIPTTVLSQCDSGVGVKNGVNAFGKKNFIGTFAPPFAVINDFQLLASLPSRDKRAGYSEAVKVACIRDRQFFDWLEREAARLREFEPEPLRQLIRRCAELHVNHIATSGDPFETGSARPLDFGHWVAHKLEQLANFALPHGEAVAVGIAVDVIYSRRMNFLSAAEAERVLTLLEALGFELFHSELATAGAGGSLRVLEGLEEFREHLGGRLAITLLRGIGSGFEVPVMDLPVATDSIEELRARREAALAVSR